MAQQTPKGLSARGRRLWQEINEGHELDPMQKVLLEEACRSADRLDMLDGMVREGNEAALAEARQQQNVFKQLLASLRLPDASGARPQQRGGARGSYSPKKSGTGAANVVSLADRFG